MEQIVEESGSLFKAAVINFQLSQQQKVLQLCESKAVKALQLGFAGLEFGVRCLGVSKLSDRSKLLRTMKNFELNTRESNIILEAPLCYCVLKN